MRGSVAVALAAGVGSCPSSLAAAEPSWRSHLPILSSWTSRAAGGDVCRVDAFADSAGRHACPRRWRRIAGRRRRSEKRSCPEPRQRLSYRRWTGSSSVGAAGSRRCCCRSTVANGCQPAPRRDPSATRWTWQPGLLISKAIGRRWHLPAPGFAFWTDLIVWPAIRGSLTSCWYFSS